MQPYVIIRAYYAGVHCGRLVKRAGKTVYLTESRRIWSWEGAKTLSHIAVSGVKSGNFGPPVEIIITDAYEIITCTEGAANNLAGQPSW